MFQKDFSIDAVLLSIVLKAFGCRKDFPSSKSFQNLTVFHLSANKKPFWKINHAFEYIYLVFWRSPNVVKIFRTWSFQKIFFSFGNELIGRKFIWPENCFGSLWASWKTSELKSFQNLTVFYLSAKKNLLKYKPCFWGFLSCVLRISWCQENFPELRFSKQNSIRQKEVGSFDPWTSEWLWTFFGVGVLLALIATSGLSNQSVCN